MSFANQALSAVFIKNNRESLANDVLPVPLEIDQEIARTKLEAMQMHIDTLTEEQERYLSSWQEGT
jgi:adenosylhomocysteinase